MRSSKRRAIPTCRAHNMPCLRNSAITQCGDRLICSSTRGPGMPGPYTAAFVGARHASPWRYMIPTAGERNHAVLEPVPFSNTRQARERCLRNEPNSGPNPNEMKPLALLRNEPNSRPPAPRTSRSQPALLSDICKGRERDLRNEPNFDPNPNKMKALAPFAKRTQFSPGPRFPSPHTKLIAIAMPASQPL